MSRYGFVAIRSDTLHDLYFLYSLSQAMLRFSQSVKGDFITWTEISMDLITCNPGHICTT